MEDWKVGDRETRVFLPLVVLLVAFQTAATITFMILASVGLFLPS